METKWVVRLWDLHDGWVDVTGPRSRESAEAEYNRLTVNGTQRSKPEHGDYYDIFPANTSMIYTPGFLGR